jgi:hypothetical protein
MSMFKRLPTLGLATLLLGAAAFGGQAKADQVFADDVIIQGSLCVGLDCTDGMNFGFDTIVLKENNLRILFDDTSASPGFPANDWRLIANDSASGGANFFALEDATAARQVFRVDAGARANSIYASSAGNIGFGTSTPVLVTHARNGNTPGQRLEQDGSLGFPPYTWDVAGNEANFFIRDVTGGSRLPFRIRPGAPTSSIDIAASGNVGVGTTAPLSKLSLDVTALADGVTVRNTTSGVINVFRSLDNTANFAQIGTTSNHDLRILTNNAAKISITAAGNVGIGTGTPATQLHTTGSVRFAGVANCAAGIQSNANGDLSCLVSSRQFKTIAGELKPATALKNVMALRPQVGAYKTTPDEPEHWLIAEDVAAVDPALAGYKDGKPYTVKTQNVIADLVAVIQQQQQRIEALEKALAR